MGRSFLINVDRTSRKLGLVSSSTLKTNVLSFEIFFVNVEELYLRTHDVNCGVRGSKENSPDLDSLRLFLAKKCNLTLPGPDLIALFMDLTNNNDDIEPAVAAKTCFRYLQNSVSCSRLVSEIVKSGGADSEQGSSGADQNQRFMYMQ